MTDAQGMQTLIVPFLLDWPCCCLCVYLYVYTLDLYNNTTSLFRTWIQQARVRS
jgi:hypothetical protein